MSRDFKPNILDLSEKDIKKITEAIFSDEKPNIERINDKANAIEARMVLLRSEAATCDVG